MPPDTHVAAELSDPGLAFAALAHRINTGDAPAVLREMAALARQTNAPTLFEQLTAWRRRAYDSLPPPAPRHDWPGVFDDPFPDVIGVPEIPALALNPAILGGALQHHGSLLVRGVMAPPDADRLRANIDIAFAARDRHRDGAAVAETTPWYVPLDAGALAPVREWVENGGAVWTADSPRNLEDLVDVFQSSGVIDTITGYLGERPALSVGKSTLRRVPITTGTDWHQDGAFLGGHIRSVNVWLALSDCGEDAAGLDVVGRRLPYVVQSGSHGAQFHWSVGPGMVDLLAEGGAPVQSPIFRPGDALLFDHLMLHRTGIRAGMTKTRWAVESWFFAPSTYPMDQIPLVV